MTGRERKKEIANLNSLLQPRKEDSSCGMRVQGKDSTASPGRESRQVKKTWARRIGFVSFLLVACAIFLVLLPRGTEMRVAAAAPVNLPSAPSLTFLPFISKAGAGPSVNPLNLWRFGTAKVRRPFSDYNRQDFDNLRLGWYIDFGANSNPETTNGMEYMPVVNMKQYKVDNNGVEQLCCVGCNYESPVKYSMSPGTDAIKTIAAAHPGWTWIIGNEQERIDVGLPGATGSNCSRQDEMMPEVYAQAYHDAYTALKSVDPTAKAAFGPMVQPSPLRIEYLQRVWDYYAQHWGTMPVDVWTVHIYVYNETKGGLGADIPAGLSETSGVIHTVADSANFTYAQQMTIGWRTWMKNHGQQNKPLITPEYGANYPPWWQDPPGSFPFLPASVRDSYMYPSFDFFLNYTDPNIGMPADGNRLVQRWAWWSMDFDFGTCVNGTYNLLNSGALFYSGLGSSPPPTNCPFPSQGVAPWGTYWTNYVQALPLGSTKPYAP